MSHCFYLKFKIFTAFLVPSYDPFMVSKFNFTAIYVITYRNDGPPPKAVKDKGAKVVSFADINKDGSGYWYRYEKFPEATSTIRMTKPLNENENPVHRHVSHTKTKNNELKLVSRGIGRKKKTTTTCHPIFSRNDIKIFYPLNPISVTGTTHRCTPGTPTPSAFGSKPTKSTAALSRSECTRRTTANR